MAPSTPAPPAKPSLAALTMASTASVVMSPSTGSIRIGGPPAHPARERRPVVLVRTCLGHVQLEQDVAVGRLVAGRPGRHRPGRGVLDQHGLAGHEELPAG